MSNFHFIRPEWLLAFALLGLAIYLVKRLRVSNTAWQQVLPKHLSKLLLDDKSSGKSSSLILPTCAAAIAIIAMAGPTWQKLPQPVYQLEQGSVVIMDMSYSMYSTDLAPNRLTRARFKANDLLDYLNEGEFGLIAYAGDAFSISPLTKDVNNIKLLLASLTPEIMPELGSNPLSALTLANDMLVNAGHKQGNIYWITDGIDGQDVQDITEWSRAHPHKLNILGIGTKSGAPIKLPNGELLKDNTGAIVVPKLSVSYLEGSASRGRGVYQTITNDMRDINALADFAKHEQNNETDKKPETLEDDLLSGDQWQEFGPYLLLLVLPLVLYCFRKGVVAALALIALMLPQPQAHANSVSDTVSDAWQSLWKTKNQQAQQAFNAGNFEQAANNFDHEQWQGSAQYKAGNYEQALEHFKKSDSADALYNQGNALAKMEKFTEATKAYEQALAINPNHENAKKNKAIVEQIQKQKQQQQNKDGQSGDGEQQDQQDGDDQNGDQQSGDNSQNGQQGEQQQSDDNSGQSADSSSQNNDQQNAQHSDNQQNDASSSGANEQSESENSQSQENDANNDKSTEESSEQSAEKQAQQANAQQGDESEADGQTEKTAAQLAQEQRDQETEQKHQQLLNKVTNDPHLLLRNKMRLEYQKRRHEQSQSGVKKQW